MDTLTVQLAEFFQDHHYVCVFVYVCVRRVCVHACNWTGVLHVLDWCQWRRKHRDREGKCQNTFVRGPPTMHVPYIIPVCIWEV